jgi:hypothetical protein
MSYEEFRNSPVIILSRLYKTRREALSIGRTYTPALLDICTQFKKAECEDLRDCVFGFISLAADCCQKACPADYSMTVREVYNRLLDHHFSLHLQDPPGLQQDAYTLYHAMGISRHNLLLDWDDRLALHNGWHCSVERVIWSIPAIKFTQGIKHQISRCASCCSHLGLSITERWRSQGDHGSSPDYLEDLIDYFLEILCPQTMDSIWNRGKMTPKKIGCIVPTRVSRLKTILLKL